jgi:hypothetical protein
MPGGKTVRGYWTISGPTGVYAMDHIAYLYQMASTLTTHVIGVGAVAPAGCSGNADNPGAAAGHLCIFEKEKASMTDPIVFFNTKVGVGLYSTVTSGSAGFVDGTWAATSPAATTAAASGAVVSAPAGGPGNLSK